MANKPGRSKYSNIVLKRGYSVIPQDPDSLARFLLDVLTGSPDGDAKVGLLIDQIAASGEPGRKLLRQTQSKEISYYTITLTSARIGLAQRIREKIGSRLAR